MVGSVVEGAGATEAAEAVEGVAAEVSVPKSRGCTP